MNERIKELAKDYLLHERFTRYGESIQEDYYEMYPDELEKFAELIIKDCAEWIKNTDSDPDIGEEDAQALLDHFGIEDDKTA